jgi:hypothetical protein
VFEHTLLPTRLHEKTHYFVPVHTYGVPEDGLSVSKHVEDIKN